MPQSSNFCKFLNATNLKVPRICRFIPAFVLHFPSAFIRLRGGAGQNIVLLIFQPTHFIVHVIYYNQYEKIWRKKQNYLFPHASFHGNDGHLLFYGTHQGTYNFKTASLKLKCGQYPAIHTSYIISQSNTL